MTEKPKEVLTLSFGTHTLVFLEFRGELFVELRLVKTGGTQTLPRFPVPEGITLESIAHTWEVQGKTYIQLHNPHWPCYIAGRSLLYFRERDMALLWNLTHYQDIPFDTWGWVNIDPDTFNALRKMGEGA